MGLYALRAANVSLDWLPDVAERSTNLVGYSEVSGGFEKNNENLDKFEEMAILQHFGCGVAQKRYIWI